MKKFFAPLGLCAIILIMAAAVPGQKAAPHPLPASLSRAVAPVPDFGSVPLYFIPNRGQADAEAVYYARASRYTLWLTKTGFFFDSSRSTAQPDSPRANRITARRAYPSANRLERDVSELRFPGANGPSAIEAQDVSEHKVNLFLGKDPAGWTTDLATSRAVLYRDLFKGIDLKVYGVEKEVEYDWVVKPGAAVGDIRFEYRGVRGTSLEPDGSLRVRTRFGDLFHRRPEAYQTIAGRKTAVAVRFRTLGDNRYGFAAESYDLQVPLVIDPVVLVSSTYLGGSQGDYLSSLAVDADGNIYVTGDTQSPNYPTKNAIDSTLSGKGYDMIITKLAASGKSLVYSTYLGGSDWDSGSSIAVDSTGAAYIAGWTKSSDFPVKKAFDPTFNGDYDGVFLKLTPGGDALAFSSYLGAKDPKAYEGCDILYLDGQGNIYVAGDTNSADFPVKAGYDMTYNGGGDVFISKFAPSGRSLIYSTYLGGSGQDYPTGLAVDSKGAIFVSGFTTSTDFPKKNSNKKTIDGYSDAFVTKLNPSGTSLGYSTVFGGSDRDRPYRLQIDAAGNAYVVGETESADFPVCNAFDSTYAGGDGDVFLTKIPPTGNPFVFSTYLGGTGEDEGESLAVDAKGYVYVLAMTTSSNLPVKNAYDKNLSGSSDAYIAKFAPSGKSLVFATYFGGSGYDDGSAIVLDGESQICFVGGTRSLNLPVKNAFDKTYNGHFDGYIAKLSEAAGGAGRTRKR